MLLLAHRAMSRWNGHATQPLFVRPDDQPAHMAPRWPENVRLDRGRRAVRCPHASCSARFRTAARECNSRTTWTAGDDAGHTRREHAKPWRRGASKVERDFSAGHSAGAYFDELERMGHFMATDARIDPATRAFFDGSFAERGFVVWHAPGIAQPVASGQWRDLEAQSIMRERARAIHRSRLARPVPWTAASTPRRGGACAAPSGPCAPRRPRRRPLSGSSRN